MSGLAFPVPKSASEVLDYAFAFRSWLPVGDQIASAVVTSSPAGLTLTAPSTNPNAVVVWASGGTPGTVYAITCTATTSAGRIVSRTATLTVQ